MMQVLLEAEFTRCKGVAPYFRAVGRGGVRDGTRSRTLRTRVGTLALRVPRDRDASFQRTVFRRYARHEQARIALLTEWYLQGVSTRKVHQVFETLSGETVSASLVSSAINAWRSRSLPSGRVSLIRGRCPISLSTRTMNAVGA